MKQGGTPCPVRSRFANSGFPPPPPFSPWRCRPAGAAGAEARPRNWPPRPPRRERGGPAPRLRRWTGAPPPWAREESGGGGSLPVEERLSVEPGAEDPEPGAPVGEAPGAGGPAAPGGGSASPGAAAWHVFGEIGTGAGGAALVTAEDLADISAMSIRGTKFGATDGDYVARYVWGGDDNDAHSPDLSQSDAWRPRGNRAGLRVRVGHNDAGQVSYGLAYAEGDFGPNAGSWVTEYSWEFDSEAAGTNIRRWSSGNRKGALFRRETGAGNLWAAVATDISGPGHTDWLATGVWAYAPHQAPPSKYLRDTRGHRFGVFADGGDSFRASGGAVAELTGTATYEGDAAGVYSRLTGATEATRRNDLFSADATLTIDFSVKPGRYREGAATGRIHNIAIDGTPIAGNPEIALREGYLTGNNNTISSDFSGTSMTFDGASWTGDWGAALFGNPASDATGADRLPGSVAGTFGVSTYRRLVISIQVRNQSL